MGHSATRCGGWILPHPRSLARACSSRASLRVRSKARQSRHRRAHSARIVVCRSRYGGRGVSPPSSERPSHRLWLGAAPPQGQRRTQSRRCPRCLLPFWGSSPGPPPPLLPPFARCCGGSGRIAPARCAHSCPHWVAAAGYFTHPPPALKGGSAERAQACLFPVTVI